MEQKDVLFPFEKIRDIQDELISAIKDAVDNKSNLIVHAPTGLGKTVAALGPALKKAEDEGLTVFFLTSRHTQHEIAIETLKAIRDKFNLSIPVVDIIGKKWMCLQPAIELLSSGEFGEYCKGMKEDGKCEFFNNLKKGKEMSILAKKTLEEAEQFSPLNVKQLMDICEENDVCPYEIAMRMSKKAKVIVADYYYIFNPSVMIPFFLKSEIDMQKSIIIVDEAHNLPSRIRDLMSGKLSTYTIKLARKEAEEFNDEEAYKMLDHLQERLVDEIGMEEEKVIGKNFDFSDKGDIAEHFEALGERKLKEGKRSFLATIAKFLNKFDSREGFVNIIRHVKGPRGERIELKHTCLDPSIATQDVFVNSYASIIMSGTLEPIEMYKEVLGIEGKQLELKSPFPEKNRLHLIIPETTTKFSERCPEQFENMAKILAKIVNQVPGNSAVFFPSYYIRDEVLRNLQDQCEKTIFNEFAGMSKEDKENMLDNFKQYKSSGAVLLGAASGSFGEGIDLPGELLKCVIIVGLPLSMPDLETKALIDYYDKKYKKGWDYGYILPALSKVMQNAGRCIRSENDKGIVIFLDRRYVWENYKKCLSTEAKIDRDYEKTIKNFFYSP